MNILLRVQTPVDTCTSAFLYSQRSLFALLKAMSTVFLMRRSLRAAFFQTRAYCLAALSCETVSTLSC